MDRIDCLDRFELPALRAVAAAPAPATPFAARPAPDCLDDPARLTSPILLREKSTMYDRLSIDATAAAAAGRERAPAPGHVAFPRRETAPLPRREIAPLPGRETAPLPGREIAPWPGREIAQCR
ncbi:MAG TPA: hypothetical protein VGK20_09500 [Candidatus Binatia bacterium]